MLKLINNAYKQINTHASKNIILEHSGSTYTALYEKRCEKGIFEACRVYFGLALFYTQNIPFFEIAGEIQITLQTSIKYHILLLLGHAFFRFMQVLTIFAHIYCSFLSCNKSASGYYFIPF